MLETPEERIKLLRAGLMGKTIEKLYIERNGFKLVRDPNIFELVELDIPHYTKTCIRHEIAVESI
jgi:hypothetical protein